MININDKNREICCGCAACANICPRQCIELVEDREGFIYPVVDSSLCINCGLCERVCPMTNTFEKKMDFPTETYAGRTVNEEIRNRSSSGGIFFELAKHTISKSGHVYGVQVSEDCLHFEHVKICLVSELHRILGSKYGESRLNHCFREIKNDLNDNIPVLFSGTPCQVEGLKRYLGKDYCNLLCIDFICHGVPSAKTWRQYVEYHEKRENAKAIQVSFRDKRNGWQRYALNLKFDNGNEHVSDHANDMYMKLYLNNVSVRPSCLSCKFRKKHRLSDITIADFWGVKEYYPELDDDNGTSLIIVHSEEGKKALCDIDSEICLNEVDSERAFKKNPSLTKQFIKTFIRDKYFNSIDTLTIEDACEKYTRMPLWKKTGRKVKKLLLYLFDMLNRK